MVKGLTEKGADDSAETATSHVTCNICCKIEEYKDTSTKLQGNSLAYLVIGEACILELWSWKDLFKGNSDLDLDQNEPVSTPNVRVYIRYPHTKFEVIMPKNRVTWHDWTWV